MSGCIPTVHVRRWYAAPRALVYRAFTDASVLEQWFCPTTDAEVRVTDLDVRVGGTYRFLYSFPDRVASVVGEYRRVESPVRLEFTWTWEAPDPFAGEETLVTVDFVERDGGTEVSVAHAQLPTEDHRLMHMRGWGGALDRLERHFTPYP